MIYYILCHGRTDGAGELYAYLPLTDQNAAALLNVPPLTIENPDYGFSVGRGAFTFPAGEWVTIAERIKLNDPASYNGTQFILLPLSPSAPGADVPFDFVVAVLRLQRAS